jgi:DNA-binding NarL/FixJ family response regulator
MGRVLQKLCVRNRTEAVVLSQSQQKGGDTSKWL